MKGRRGCATVCGFSLGPVSHILRFETGNSRRIPRVRTPARVRGAFVCAKQKRAPWRYPNLVSRHDYASKLSPATTESGVFLWFSPCIDIDLQIVTQTIPIKRVNRGFYESKS